jgi:carboxyl-terminal processing protease
MVSQHRFAIIVLLISTLVIYACGDLPSFGSDETTDFPLGPQITLAEHQANVFEDIFKHIQDNYVYYETSKIDWDSLKQTYLDEIDKGLTSAEFNDLMTEFESEFGEEEIIYVSRDEKIEAQTIIPSTQFAGIGAFVSFQAEKIPHVAILDVMPDSPAEKAGIRAHDSIYAVNGEPVLEEEGPNVVQRIRGEAGTTVVLTVQTPGEEKREVEITRAQVQGIGELKTTQLPDTEIAYVLMPSSFSEDIMNQFALVLSDYFEVGTAKGLIIDLRISNNSTWPIDEMTTLFLNGDMGSVYNRSESRPIEIEGQDIFGSQTMPIVVLVGEHTNGPAEIFAAFVQSSGRGVVLGSNTEGNIEAPVGFPLPDGGQIFIANTAIQTTGDENIGLNGFSPQVQNEARWDEINPVQDPVIEQAIQSFKFEVQE